MIKLLILLLVIILIYLRADPQIPIYAIVDNKETIPYEKVKVDVYIDSIDFIQRLEYIYYPFFLINNYITETVETLLIYKNDNVYEILDRFCDKWKLELEDCSTLLSLIRQQEGFNSNHDIKPKFVVVSFPYLETSGGIVVAHYLVDRLNHFFSDRGSPIAFIMQITEADNVTLIPRINPNYNTPTLTRLQYRNDDSLIVIYPEVFVGNIDNKKMVVRWILYFLQNINVAESLNYKHVTESFYKYKHSDYIACYSKGICRQFDDSWHKHPLTVVDINLDIVDTIDTNRIRDIDVVYFYSSRKEKNLWIDREGLKRSVVDRVGFDYMIMNTFKFLNKTVIRMNESMSKVERLELLSRTNFFISLDPATFRSVEAAIVGCLSIVIPIPGVSKEEWLSVSYSPEILRYGIAYGFDDLKHARDTLQLVVSNLNDQNKKARENLVNFIKDIKQYFNLDADFLREKLE